MGESSENLVIQSILAGNEEKIVELYDRYKIHFVHWAHKNYQLPEDDALDIFQDTIIAFYKSVRSHRLTEVEYTVRTYLYSIAKNLIFNRFRREKKHIDIDVDGLYESGSHDLDEGDEVRFLVQKLMNNIGEPCYTLLKLYYYSGYSLEAIAREIGSKNANVVKAQKARCIKTLRGMLDEKKDRIAFM